MRKLTDSFFEYSLFDILDSDLIPQSTFDMTDFRESFTATPAAIIYPVNSFASSIFNGFERGAFGNDSANMPWLNKIQNLDPEAAFVAAEYVPSDPQFNSQLNLINGTAGQLDINVELAWDDYSGAGVQINIFDNGFDYVHADLAPNYLSDIDYDYTNNDFDPIATGGNNHGTAVIGIVGAAADNGEGGVGIAFNSTLVGYQGFGIGAANSADQILDAAGLGDGIGNTNGNGSGSEIISVSAGYSSNVFLNFTSLDDGIAALETISAQGRDGLGTIYVKSSGNSRGGKGSTAREEGTAERFDSTEFSISVAALRLDGWVTDYSTPGANVLISAFADNLSNFGTIFTTDRTGTDGYSSTDYTSGFSGTSAAAPQIAGVVALMLEANPDLGWRDVQKILAASAVHVGSDIGAAANTGSASNGGFEQATQTDGSTWFWNAAGNWNGGGQHFSNDYGYGAVDATAAVRLAESWQAQSTSANQVSTFEDDFDTTTIITDGDVDGVDFIISESDDILVEHVSLELTFSTTYLADVEIFLTSPGGTRVQLISGTGDSGDFDGTWRFGTTAFMGETSAGDWELTIIDSAGGDTLTVTEAHLRTSGSTLSTDDTYLFTNEFSDYAGLAGHAVAFLDSNGGTDWINAAAVSSDSTVNLQAGTGTIDGITITLADIENIYAGDGNDILTGTSGSNTLYGGRGDDTIIGGSGNDALYGGTGDDAISFGTGTVTIDGGTGQDTLIADAGIGRLRADLEAGTATVFDAAGKFAGTASFENIEIFQATDGNDVVTASTDGSHIIGLDGRDKLTGGIGNDILEGGSGHDRLIGLEGNDVIMGGIGNDVISGGFGNDTISGGAGDDLIYGGPGTDILNGNGGLDDIRGASGADIINGGAGNDRLRGNGGNDTFVFEVGTGRDRIIDFDKAGNDRIDLTDFGFNEFADIEGNIRKAGNHVLIDLGNGDEILLLTTDVADVDASDFIL
ncbi:S8 family serine peptidase [Litorimonas sp. WD9-15]|uniref:S8 family serine peptidase n=1 Tax=Litorimonas sp. WD9-15 TaxID=3418716 RepID=UPI003CFF12C9